MAPRSPLVMLTFLCVASVSLLLAACGGSSPSSSSAAEKEQQAEVKLAAFAKCLREHGINAIPSTGPGGKGHGLGIQAGSSGSGPVSLEAVQGVSQGVCKKYRPEVEKVNLSPQEKVARAEAIEKFAKCMREHGIEVHASSSEGETSIRVNGSGGPNPGSPAFQKGQQSCQGLLPLKGNGPLGTQGTGAPSGGIAAGG